MDNSTVIFAYRTDLLAEVGKTVDDMTGIKWSDLTDIGEQVYAKTGKYLFSTSADGGDLVYMMMQSEGVAEFKDGELGSPRTKRCIVSARPSWIWASARPAIWQTAGATTSTRAFRRHGRRCAERQLDHPHHGAVTENSGKWEITTIPTLDGGEGYASNGGCGLYITANCGNVDLAKSFLAYTFGGSTQTYDNALRDGGVVTTVLKCADSDVYNEGVAFFNNEPIYKQIVEMGSHVPVIEQSDYHFRAGVYLITAIINTVNGSKLDDELANAEQQLRFEMGL